ncbi:MAG: Hint domain-containing protein [Albidovulum sp.]
MAGAIETDVNVEPISTRPKNFECPGNIEAGSLFNRQAPRTPCFTAGTLVATDKGHVLIEDLQPGDRVLTRDSGYRPIMWIGSRHFDADELSLYDELQPIIIEKGALGANTPSCDMSVSPHHRMLLTGDLSQAMGGESEVLVAAMDLTFMPGIRQGGQSTVTYFHLMFEDHEVIRADGCWTESFLPEASVLDQMSRAQRQEILTIFPELALTEGISTYAPARLCVDCAVFKQPLAA